MAAGVVISNGTGPFTQKANPVGAFLGDSDLQNISGAKRFLNLTLQMANPLNTATTTIRNPVVTVDSILPLGKNQYVIVFFDVDDSHYKVIDGTNGVVISDDANAAIPLQYALDNIGAGGGRIFIRQGLYDIGNTALTLALTNAKYVEIGGAGPATQIKRSSGTGNTLTFTGNLTSLEYLKIHDMQLLGGTGTITTSRHGIDFGTKGPSVYLDHLWLRYFDDAIRVTNSNTVVGDCIKIQNANTGVRTIDGPDTAPNSIYFRQLFANDCANEGVHINSDASTASVVQIDGGDFSICGTGIKISGNPRDVVIGPSPVYMEHNSVVDIHIAGTSTSVLPRNVYIANVRSNGAIATAIPNMIKVDYCGKLTIDNCVSYGHTSSMILLNANTDYDLRIINPYLDPGAGTPTPYLINVPSDNFLTAIKGRMAGIVEQGPVIGQIVSATTTGLAAADVVHFSGTGSGFVSSTTTADDVCPAVVLYGNAGASRPAVVVLKGLAQVTVDAATTFNDTLTTSSTTKKARVNNMAVDPKIVLGYSIQSIGAAGAAYARIG